MLLLFHQYVSQAVGGYLAWLVDIWGYTSEGTLRNLFLVVFQFQMLGG